MSLSDEEKQIIQDYLALDTDASYLRELDVKWSNVMDEPVAQITICKIKVERLLGQRPDVPMVDPTHHHVHSIVQPFDASYNTASNLMFTGPAGCGKSVGPEQLAAIQNRPYYCVSFHEDFREAEFFGENRAANGLIEWFDGEGIKAWSTPGSTILLDEVDRAEPGVLSKLHRYLNGATVEMTFPAKNGETITVKRSNGLQIVGATNGMGDSEQGMVYNSTKQMDGAFRSRWSMFEKIGYADPKIEKGLILKKLREKFDNVDTMLKKGLNNKLESIIKAANTARLDAEKHCKQLVISYRSTIKCAELMCFYNMDTTLAVHQSIINTIDEQEAQEVDTFFHSHLGDDYTRKYTASDDT